jgi:hypothetical protein
MEGFSVQRPIRIEPCFLQEENKVYTEPGFS